MLECFRIPDAKDEGLVVVYVTGNRLFLSNAIIYKILRGWHR